MQINSIHPVQASFGAENKKSSHKVLKFLTAAAITGGALYAAKTGKLNPKKNGKVIIETAKAAVKTPADALLKYFGKAAKPVKHFIDKKILNKTDAEIFQEKAEKMAKKAADTTSKLFDAAGKKINNLIAGA